MGKLQVINFFAGPGAGKSTTAAGVYSKLKKLGVRVELVTEAAKDAAWEKHGFMFSQQVLLFAEQLRRQTRVEGQRDLIVTDSPILLPGLVYNDGWKHLPGLAWEAWDRFENLNFFLYRTKPYDTEGRNETEDQAKQKDVEAKAVLDDAGIDYIMIPGDEDGEDLVVSIYMERYSGYLRV